MKKIASIFVLSLVTLSGAIAQQDLEGTKNHPMFPDRMSNYYLSEYVSNFDAVDFNLAAGGSEIVTKEGTKTRIKHDFNFESLQTKPSALQILRNYEAAAKKISGETLFLNATEGIGVYKIKNATGEVWVKVETGGSDNNDFYLLTVLEITAMQPTMISSNVLDMDGTKNHPMFPDRMTNFYRSEYVHNFDAADFNLAADESEMVTKEGTKTRIKFDFNFESGQSKPSPLQILRNHEIVVKKNGGQTIFFNHKEGIAVFKIITAETETWVKVQTGGSDMNDFYELTVLEIEAMTQEITSNEMLTALNTTGLIALYINFETGTADIKPGSHAIIDQIVELLNANPELKISIEGHTDNVGNPASNQTLSEKRGAAVMHAIIEKGIDASRLSSKGWGQTKPTNENKTDADKAKNRRVEIVKM